MTPITQSLGAILIVALDEGTYLCVTVASHVGYVLGRYSLRDQPDDLPVSTCQPVFGLAIAHFYLFKRQMFYHADFCIHATEYTTSHSKDLISHQPPRQRERTMRRFKSPSHAQRFLSAFGPISDHFRPRRHHLSASEYRAFFQERFETWNEITKEKSVA